MMTPIMSQFLYKDWQGATEQVQKSILNSLYKQGHSLK